MGDFYKNLPAGQSYIINILTSLKDATPHGESSEIVWKFILSSSILELRGKSKRDYPTLWKELFFDDNYSKNFGKL